MRGLFNKAKVWPHKDKVMFGMYAVGLVIGAALLATKYVEWTKAHETLVAGGIGAYLIAGGWLWVWRAVSHADRDRHCEFLRHMGELWDSPLIISGRRFANEFGKDGIKRTLKANGETRRKGYFELTALGGFFEELGIAVRQRHITLELVNERLGAPIGHYYDLYSGFVNKAQQTDEGIYNNFRELAEAIHNLRQQVLGRRTSHDTPNHTINSGIIIRPR